MSIVLDQRYDELRALEARAIRWAREHTDVAAIVLVGSFARNAARPDSDIDLILLVEDPEQLNTNTRWLADLAPDAQPLRTGHWGRSPSTVSPRPPVWKSSSASPRRPGPTYPSTPAPQRS